MQYHALQSICNKPIKDLYIMLCILMQKKKKKRGQAVLPCVWSLCLQLVKVTNRCPLAPVMQGKSVQERSLRDNGAFVQFRVPAGVPSCTLSSNLPLTFMMMTFPKHFFLTSFIWRDGQHTTVPLMSCEVVRRV